MSLTRKFLKALGLEDEKIDQIIEAHTETVDALKQERDQAKSDTETLAAVTKERDKLQAKITDLEAKAPDAAKVQADFDAFKAQVEAEKANAQKATLLQQALASAGVARESAQKALLKAVDLTTVKLTTDGKLDGVDALIAPLKTEFSDFFATTQTGGIPTVTPPPSGKPSITKEQLAKMNLRERNDFATSNPDAYKALKGD
jgi:DNA repair exonuclease SbcCD ATPase subunit